MTPRALLAIAPIVAVLAACTDDPAHDAGPVERPDAATSAPVATPSAATATATGGAPAADPATPAATPALAVEAEGVRLFDRASGSARPLGFGSDWPAVRTALAFRGPPGTGTNGECGAGPLDFASWPDGLTLYAQRGKFAGWALDGRAAGALGTAAGIGPGSTRAELDAAYDAKVREMTLGTEFAAGEIFGVLDGTSPRAKITAMWAGVSCNFR